MNSVLAGAAAGFTATFPMTGAMKAMHERLPFYERYPLPPREITERVADAGGIESEPAIATLTVLNHFGYGTACGAVFAAIENRLPGPAVARGMTFGTLVWSASYLGWLPALGILKPATEHPMRRNIMMVAAHLVWGAVLGTLHQRLTEGESMAMKNQKANKKTNEPKRRSKAADELVENKDYRGYNAIHGEDGMTGLDAPAEGEREPEVRIRSRKHKEEISKRP